jgi:aldehyde dehydrogenase (NAD+)
LFTIPLPRGTCFIPQEEFMATATAERPRTKPPKVKDQPLFIGGKFVDSVSGKTFPAINPATGGSICQVAEADKADVDLAVKAARQALESGPWNRIDAADRGRLLFKLADLVEKNAEDLAALESLNSGKIITDARSDLVGVVNTVSPGSRVFGSVKRLRSL